jgi:HD-GYP domain-containing protein (c-di-GMP phosphodiesterase class II)
VEGTFRLAEVLGAMSLATDLANGYPLEKSLRTTVIATRLAKKAGGDAACTFSTALIRFIGCTSFAHEEAHFYGAGLDNQLRNTMAAVDFADPKDFVKRVVPNVGKGAPLGKRVRAVARLLSEPETPKLHALAQCDAGVHLAKILGSRDEVIRALGFMLERWDGKGLPHGTRGEEIPFAIRAVTVADVAELFYTREGPRSVAPTLKKRRGGQLEPRLVDLFLEHEREIMEPLGQPSVWDAFLAVEPKVEQADASRLRAVAHAFARYADLKSVYTLGHSHAVATLCQAAAPGDLLYCAALLHDVGRVAVPTGIWDKKGPLSEAEWDRVRHHTYETNRILSKAKVLKPLADIASRAHERLDASGYFRGAPASQLDKHARVLAAADAYHARTEERPHRRAMPAAQAAREVEADAARGLLDRDAVRAVLSAAGHTTKRAAPSGLTGREIEILRQVVTGKSNKEIALLFGISPRTVQHHTIHIYAKLGVASRAGAALAALERGILSTMEEVEQRLREKHDF